jgi:hypothetical protein
MQLEETVISETPQAEAAPAHVDAPEVAQVEGEEAAAPEETERDEKGRFKGVQNRIDELTRKRGEAEREAAYWRAQAQAQNPTATPAAPTKPTPDKFNDYGEYVEALTDWKADQAVAKRMDQDSSRKAADTVAQTFQERQTALRATVPDYDTVVGASTTPIANHVAQELLDSERGPELSYHFAKNPDALLRLNGLTPTQAAREIGKLEATLPAFTAPVKKTTAAPSPAATLGTQGRSTTPTLGTASMDEYRAQRKAQGARWAR